MEHPIPRIVFWETTTDCNLRCVHCRACPTEKSELTTEEGKALIADISTGAKPLLVLSGGEPLTRSDIFELAEYARSAGLPVALATNGTLVTAEIAARIKESGIRRVSISIDGADADTHDEFRRHPGAFEEAWRGIEEIRAQGVPYQINTTVTKQNIGNLEVMLKLAKKNGAAALHLFMLVPTGCGRELSPEEMLSPAEYETVLTWLHDRSEDIDVRATCAPHYHRIAQQRGSTKRESGCLAGSSVAFVSRSGEVYPCGYLPVSAGNIRKKSFADIWSSAEVFITLRDAKNLHGKCGRCEYAGGCMGCRARAYACTGDYLSAEPYCAYEP